MQPATSHGGGRVMRQCVADPNVWKIVDPDTSDLVALMTCYVDDILVVGPVEERKAFLECLSIPRRPP